VKEGTLVAEDEPVVEVMAGSITVDLPAPIDGVLVRKYIATGESIAIGQRLALIEENAE